VRRNKSPSNAVVLYQQGRRRRRGEWNNFLDSFDSVFIRSGATETSTDAILVNSNNGSHHGPYNTSFSNSSNVLTMSPTLSGLIVDALYDESLLLAPIPAPPPSRQQHSAHGGRRRARRERGQQRLVGGGSRKTTPPQRFKRLNEQRAEFLERISVVASSLLSRDERDTAAGVEGSQSWYATIFRKKKRNATATNVTDEFVLSSDQDWNAVTPQSDLDRPGRYFHIVTTASLPWFTGTAVNP
jgi:hypothetical protein